MPDSASTSGTMSVRFATFMDEMTNVGGMIGSESSVDEICYSVPDLDSCF